MNIVVGNIWNQAHSNYKNKKIINENNVFENLLKEEETKPYLQKVKDYMLDEHHKYLNKFVVTTMPIERKSAFYDQTIYPKGVAQYSMHDGNKAYDTNKLGGFNYRYASYVVAVKYCKDSNDSNKNKKNNQNNIFFDLLPVYIKDRHQAHIIGIAKYFENQNLKEVSIVSKQNHIPFYSLIEIDGVRYLLKGRDKDNLQLAIDVEWQPSSKIIEIIDDIETYLNKIKNKELTKENDNLFKINYADNKELSKEKNKQVFDEIISQLRKPMFKLYRFVKKLKKNKINLNKFYDLSIYEQFDVILKLLNFIKNGNKTSCDLTAINGCKEEKCIVVIGSSLTNSTVYLITQSVTGLFSKRILLNEPINKKDQ